MFLKKSITLTSCLVILVLMLNTTGSKYDFFRSFDNKTIVHIFYRDRYSKLYKHDVVYRWFEMLGK